MNRRDFIEKGSLSIGAFSLASSTIKTSSKDRYTIVLPGDSITDGGRNRSNYYANDSWGMGNGYAHLIACDLLASYPDKNLNIYNRGIGGNKVFQLANRWQEDCLQLQPDVLSILIGVNDFWHTLSNNYKGDVDTYDQDLRMLVDNTLERFPKAKLMIGEPFYVRGGTAITDKWSEFVAYQNAARAIAEKYHTAYVPYQSVFDKALESAPVSYWCPDGVHPSLAGCHLMKEAWITAYEKI